MPAALACLSDTDRCRAVAAGVPVDALSPSRWWIVALDSMSDSSPTDAELRALGVYTRWLCSRYQEPTATRLAQMALPCGRPGQVTTVFCKFGHGGWGYRRSTWRSGPLYVPGPGDEPMALLDVLDLIHRDFSPWADFKATRRELQAPDA